MDMARAYRPTIPVVPTSRDSTVAETDCTEINLSRVGDGTLRVARVAARFVVAAAASALLHGVVPAQSLSAERERARKKDAFRRTTLIGFRVARTLDPQRVSHALEGC